MGFPLSQPHRGSLETSPSLKSNLSKPTKAEKAPTSPLTGPETCSNREARGKARTPSTSRPALQQPRSRLPSPGCRNPARGIIAGGNCGEAPSSAPCQPQTQLPTAPGRAGQRGGGGGEGGRSILASPFPVAGFPCSISMLEVSTELRREDLPGCAGPSSFLCASPSPGQAVSPAPAATSPLHHLRSLPRPWRQEEAASPGRQSRGSGKAPAATSCHPLPGAGTEAASPPASLHPSPLRSAAAGSPLADAARLPGPLVLNAERRQDGGVSERGRGALVRPAGPGAG